MEILSAMEVPPEVEVLSLREVLSATEVLLVRKVLLEMVTDILVGRSVPDGDVRNQG